MVIYKSYLKDNNWSLVETELEKINLNCIFVSSCDNYFKNNNKISETWYGIIHNPIGWEKYSLYNDDISIFEVNTFLESLPFCKILFVMSETQIEPTLKLLLSKGFNDIQVFSLCCPINNLNYLFDYDKYANNNTKTIYSIGNWLCKQESIFKLNCNQKFNKAIVPFTPDTKLELELYLKNNNIILSDHEYKSVYKIEHLNTNYYHNIFENNLIFLDLHLTNINNIFLEAVISNTPIILNRKLEYILLIGGDYPLFFDDINDVNSFIASDSNILNAHNYLKNVNKEQFKIQHFINYVTNCIERSNRKTVKIKNNSNLNFFTM